MSCLTFLYNSAYILCHILHSFIILRLSYIAMSKKRVLLHTFSADFVSALIFTDLENVCPSFRSHLSKEDVYWVERVSDTPFQRICPTFCAQVETPPPRIHQHPMLHHLHHHKITFVITNKNVCKVFLAMLWICS